jgi:DNA-binding response OmpR family regulator
MSNLIFLEDEAVLRNEIADFLREIGHTVDTVDSIKAFDQTFKSGTHLIALIDLGLPDGDGLDLIGRLRAHGEQIGIIIITARNSSANKISGLLTGSDHYLTKPFDLNELAATINALLRRINVSGSNQHWRLNAKRFQLIPPGKAPIPLTAQSYIVLRTIANGCGEPVDRQVIVKALGEDYLQYDNRRLDTQIHHLRKTIIDACGLELPVRTARGRGYMTSTEIKLES